MLILAELITFIIFAQNKQLRERPGDIIMGILLTSFILNIHYFATAGKPFPFIAVYDTTYPTSGPRPNGFEIFCDTNAFISIFCTLIQTFYLISLCLHIVFSLRSNLKCRVLGYL